MTAVDGVAGATDRAGRNWFLTAAGVTLLGAGVHVLAGTPEVMEPLYASDLPPASAGVLDVVWQQVTALLVGSVVAMLVGAARPGWRRPVAWLVGGHFAVVAIIFVIWGFVWFGTPWPMPQWALFAPVAAMLAWGAQRRG